jgi:DNA-binding response OmpR family regulator
MRIGILEDNIFIGEMLQQGLKLEGHPVVVYYSPTEFLAHISEPTIASTSFDLVIIDLFFSEGISGVEVIHHVRRILPDLPAIFIAVGSSWQIEAARRALPTVRVLRKPFSMTILLAMIQELQNF